MNNKGFVIIETIVTAVILSTALLLLYNSYSTSFNDERARIRYDDPAYIYKSNQIIKAFFKEMKKSDEHYNNFVSHINNELKSVITIGTDYYQNEIFKNIESVNKINEITSKFKVNQMVLIKKNFVNECFNDEADPNNFCNFPGFDATNEFKKYIRRISGYDNYDYYIAIEFSERPIENSTDTEYCIPGKGISANCRTYYAYLGVNL